MNERNSFIAKPKHLGREYAEVFMDESVVAAYRYRPLYPDAVFDILSSLIPAGHRAVLDVGCGSGNVARYLIPHVERIDAVDFSDAMTVAAQRLPHGDHPGINWITAAVEEAPLSPPYGLITAGSSLHWMDWGVVFPRFREALASGGVLAIVSNDFSPAPWQDELVALIGRYSTNQDYQPYDLVALLEARGLFERQGETYTEPVHFTQTVDDYITAIHSTNGLSRERMTPEQAAAFDDAVRELAGRHIDGDSFTLKVRGKVVWGRPLVP